MQKNYTLGDSSYDAKTLTATSAVSTIGVADTIIAQISGGQNITKAQSANADNGNIANPVSIGTIANLRNSSLKIVTTIDLGAANLPSGISISQVLQQVRVSYTINGGYSGNQTYTPDADDITTSQSGTYVVIVKTINLV